MKLTYFLRDNGGCGYYRADLPFKTIAASGEAKVFKIEKGDNADHISKGFDADVVMIPRVSEEQMITIMKDLQRMGKKVVVDYDDDMFNISPFSPHYGDFGTENVVVQHEGQSLVLWEDGRNINLKLNRKRADAVRKACELADMVTTTTSICGDVYRAYNDNIVELPNCLDLSVWQKLPLKEHEEVRLFWAGGASHYGDWCLLSEALPIVMRKYPQAKLVLMGSKFDGTLKDIPKDRIEFHQWVPTPAYPYKIAILNPDIALIPLEDNTFNRSKSCLKFIEQGALEVPAVCSLVSPYKEVYTGANGVFIENNSTKGWVDGISALIEDKMLRWKIGGESRKVVEQYFNIEKQYTKWLNAYREIL